MNVCKDMVKGKGRKNGCQVVPYLILLHFTEFFTYPNNFGRAWMEGFG